MQCSLIDLEKESFNQRIKDIANDLREYSLMIGDNDKEIILKTINILMREDEIKELKNKADELHKQNEEDVKKIKKQLNSKHKASGEKVGDMVVRKSK